MKDYKILGWNKNKEFLDIQLENLKEKANSVELILAKDAQDKAKINNTLNDKENACSYYRLLLHVKNIISDRIQNAVNMGKFEIIIGDKNTPFKFPYIENITHNWTILCSRMFRTDIKLVNEISKWLTDSGYKVNYYHKEDLDSPQSFELYAFKISWKD